MRIIGDWFLFDDGIKPPIIWAKVQGKDGALRSDRFLIDPGADRSVLSATLLTKLGFTTRRTSPDFSLSGIGGASPFILVQTFVEFIRDDGGPARVRGEFAAFTDTSATDLSILGRDVLNNFDVILSNRRNEVLLLAGNHSYTVT
jgi:hypothetical protein